MRPIVTFGAVLVFMCICGVGASLAFDALPTVLDKALNQPMPAVDYEPAFAASDFNGAAIDNEYFPMKPGMTMHYSGTKSGHATTEDFDITDQHQMIDGVSTTVIYDRTWQEGVLIEETHDWYAQDRSGNVWYFGEKTRALDKGKWTTEGSWQAGVDGARPGVMMQAKPKIGDAYMQEFYLGHAGDTAAVLSLSEPISVPLGTYKSAQLTMEWSTDDPGSIDGKYYVAGIGVVKELAATGAVESMSLESIKPTK